MRAPAGEGGRVGAVSGRGCRAAGEGASARWAGPRRGGLERRGGRPGRLCGWAESEAAAREGEKLFFIYIFKNFLKASFQILF